MKISKRVKFYIYDHRWAFGGFFFIFTIGTLLHYIGEWDLGDNIAILAIITSIFVMLYNGHRTDLRFAKLIVANSENTKERVLWPERRKELLILGEDLEVLYLKSHDKQISIENIIKNLETKKDINDEFLKDIMTFLHYLNEKVSSHNLSTLIKLIIFSEYPKLNKNIDTPLSDKNKNEIINLTLKLYKQVDYELDN